MDSSPPTKSPFKSEHWRLRQAVTVALLVGWVLTSGCSSFNREWAKAGNADASSSGLIGRWQGTWQSEVNSHEGALRCLVRRDTAGNYQARFHATYQKVLSFGYTVPLVISETNGAFAFSGEANLGWWAGGVYHYDGRVEGSNFWSNYRCKYDHGTFQMSRSAPDDTAAAK